MTARDALQDCLAAEHAAIYGYGVLGGVLAGDKSATRDQALAAAGYVAHRARRDDLATLIADLDLDPVPAEPAYATPFPITDTSDCRRLGRHIEHGTAAVYAFAVARTVDGTRRMLASALIDAARREVRWGGKAQAFPGATDL